MDTARSLRPRDCASAARSAAALAAVSTVVTLMFIVTHRSAGSAALLPVWGCAGALATTSVLLLRLPDQWIARLLLVVPLAGVVGDASLALNGHDASAAAQVSLTLPVLFAASQFRPLGAWIVVAAAVGAEALIAHLLPPMAAHQDAAYVTAAMLSTSVLLIRAGQRQDRLVARLSAAAATDVLTGLSTRRSFDEAAAEALAAVPPEGAALLLVDVDSFKAVNDTWGHPVGDDALVHIAGCLASVVGAGAGAVLGRLGGDEFAAVLPRCTEAEASALASAMAEAVRSSPLRLSGGQHLGLSVSVGSAHAATGGMSLREVYAAADADLYRAKHTRLPDPAVRSTRSQPLLGRRANRDDAPYRMS